ncbi:MAG: hypothetical protein NTX55_02910 [Candidatus Parcubacteria bacterium]|nr:hypothetical protein [Candidatus Parcubacteria bacterium]
MPSQSIIDNDLQLSVYHLGLTKRWPQINPEKIKLSFYFLKHGEKISTSRTPEQLDNTKKFLYNSQFSKSKSKTEAEIKNIIKEYFDIKIQGDKNSERLNELKMIIQAFMEEQKVERVFGDAGYITKKLFERNIYDMKKIKEILEELGKWQEVATKKQYTTLFASRKKVKE